MTFSTKQSSNVTDIDASKDVYGYKIWAILVCPSCTKLTMFCTTSNGNKLVLVTSWINADANLYLIWYSESK